MPFLSVVCAYLLSRYWLPHNAKISQLLQNDRWVNTLLDNLIARYPGKQYGLFALSLCVAVVFVLMWLLPFWLELFFGLVILLYSLGSDAWRQYLARSLNQLENGNAEAVWLALESEGSIDTSCDNPDTFWHAIRRHVASGYLDNLFAIFFWFCLLGPAGALFYHLLLVHNRRSNEQSNSQSIQMQLQTIGEWLPARYMGLCFCLAGNFSSCFAAWRHLALDAGIDNREFLSRCLDAALLLDDENSNQPPPETQEQVAQVLRRGTALQELLTHTEIIGLVGLALTVLLI